MPRAGSPTANEELFLLDGGVTTDSADADRMISDSLNLIPPIGGRTGELVTRGGFTLFDTLVPTAGEGAVVIAGYPSLAAGQSTRIGDQVIYMVIIRSTGQIVTSNFSSNFNSANSVFYDPGDNPYGGGD